jgi:hypothetical protein
VSRTKSNEMWDALPDLTLAIRIDGGIHDYIGGAALPTLRPKRRAVEGGFESSWSSQMDTLVKLVVRHAIAGRTRVNAELIDNSIRYDIRAIAKRPDLAICVIRLSTAQTATDQAEVAPAPHLDRRGFLRGLSDSLSVATLKEQRLAISIIRVEGLQDLIRPHREPRPNYWAAFLWRRLMGTTVLDAGRSEAGLHLYAHCLREHPGGVALLAINTSRTQSRSINLLMPGDRYSLAADKLESPSVRLNGQTLHLGSNDELPALRGATVPAGATTLPPASIIFLTFATANNSNCH